MYIEPSQVLLKSPKFEKLRFLFLETLLSTKGPSHMNTYNGFLMKHFSYRPDFQRYKEYRFKISVQSFVKVQHLIDFLCR